MNVFEFVSSINHTKVDLMSGSENDKAAEEFYNPFVVNRSLSYFVDTLFYANEINKYDIDKKLQYHYLLNSVRPSKRFAKWVKPEVEHLEDIKQYYGYSTEKARQVLSVLTTEQICFIKQKLQRGGNDDKNSKSSGNKTKEQ
jgi:hypothetical protein